MKCEETRKLLNQLIDGELDAPQEAKIHEHFNKCPLCQLEFKNEQSFDGLLRNYMPKEQAPYELREAVVDQLANSRPFWELTWFKPIWKYSLGGAFFVVIGVMILMNVSHKPFPVFTESISNHVDYLKGSYPLEIKSADTKEVESWFRGKLDFAVKVPDLREHGFDLLGARLVHLNDRRVAYLVYEKDGHYLSASFVNTDALRIPHSIKSDDGEHIHYAKSINGYQSILCIHKTKSGPGCIFVTDLPEQAISHFI